MDTVIFKICPAVLWQKAEAAGRFEGATIDLEDGFIHFSSASQVRETAALHFAGQDDLMLIAAKALALGDALTWEASRNGDLFPHLYGSLNLAAVLWAKPLPWDGSAHVFPKGFDQ